MLIFSDIHIHNHKNSLQRLSDCLSALRWALTTARKRNIKDVVFLGDLFHDRQKINILAYNSAFDVLREFSDLQIFLLLGNHDLWYFDRWDVSSVLPLMALPNVEVISKPCTKEINGLKIDFLPFTTNPIKMLEDFKEKSPILCSHLALDGAKLNNYTKAEVSVENEKDVVKVTKDFFKGWQRVFLGHYHCAQRIDNIEYIGSPLELSFGEAFQEKHLAILDIDTLECDYVINDFSPKHLILREDQLQNFDLTNNFIQVLVETVQSNIVDIKNNITNAQTLEFKEVKKETKQDYDLAKFNIATGDVLERFVKCSETDLNVEKLLNIGKEICCAN